MTSINDRVATGSNFLRPYFQKQEKLGRLLSANNLSKTFHKTPLSHPSNRKEEQTIKLFQPPNAPTSAQILIHKPSNHCQMFNTFSHYQQYERLTAIFHAQVPGINILAVPSSNPIRKDHPLPLQMSLMPTTITS